MADRTLWGSLPRIGSIKIEDIDRILIGVVVPTGRGGVPRLSGVLVATGSDLEHLAH
jgi:hypothetical protein